MTLGVALGSPNTSDIFEKRPIELGVQNVHGWPRPGHPGINRPAWHLLTRSVFRSRMQRISRRSCDHSPLESLSLDLRHGQRSLPSHTQISVVRVPLGASTAIARRAKCLGHAHAEAALVDGSCPTSHRHVVLAARVLRQKTPSHRGCLPLWSFYLRVWGTLPQQCTPRKSMGKRDQFCRVNPRKLPALPWLRAYLSSFRMSLRAHPCVGSISHLGLGSRTSCQLQHQRAGLSQQKQMTWLSKHLRVLSLSPRLTLR